MTTRTSHSHEFKRSVVEASWQADASIASVALVHGINTNLLRKWRRQFSGTRVPAIVSEPALIPVAAKINQWLCRQTSRCATRSDNNLEVSGSHVRSVQLLFISRKLARLFLQQDRDIVTDSEREFAGLADNFKIDCDIRGWPCRSGRQGYQAGVHLSSFSKIVSSKALPSGAASIVAATGNTQASPKSIAVHFAASFSVISSTPSCANTRSSAQ